MTIQYKNLINGELVDNGQWIDVVNPATEQVIGQVPDCGQAELDKAVAAARAAFQTWKKTSVEERRAQDEQRRADASAHRRAGQATYAGGQ